MIFIGFSETTKILKEEWEKDKSTFREQATMSNEPTNRQEGKFFIYFFYRAFFVIILIMKVLLTILEQKHYVGRVTAYTLWCRDVRSEFQNNHPGMSKNLILNGL